MAGATYLNPGPQITKTDDTLPLPTTLARPIGLPVLYIPCGLVRTIHILTPYSLMSLIQRLLKLVLP